MDTHHHLSQGHASLTSTQPSLLQGDHMYYELNADGYFVSDIPQEYPPTINQAPDWTAIQPPQPADNPRVVGNRNASTGEWIGEWQDIGPAPLTDEQLREEWKAQRAAQVEAIKVTTQAGNTFDGDEVSQGRMARAIIALDASAPGTTVNWVLADNSVIGATALELVEALALAGAAQAAVWVAP
jgi:hypothetical protein